MSSPTSLARRPHERQDVPVRRSAEGGDHPHVGRVHGLWRGDRLHRWRCCRADLPGHVAGGDVVSRRLSYILAPVFMWSLICGFGAAGALLAVVHGNYPSLLMARAVLAGAVYQTALE